MNEQNKNEMIVFWLNVANYYRQNVPDETIRMYAYDTRELSLTELRTAFENYRASNQAAFMPLPAVLKNIVRPPLDEDAEANEVVSRIIHCLSPFKPAAEAQEQMGGLAWEVVRSLGGWSEFGRRPMPDSFAQRDMREMAKAKLLRARQGRTDVLPAIAGSDRAQIGGQSNKNAPRLNEKVMSLVSASLNKKSNEQGEP